jgi:hypothetical protein
MGLSIGLERERNQRKKDEDWKRKDQRVQFQTLE